MHLGKREKDGIEVFEMWIYRKIKRTNWIFGLINENVVNSMKKTRTLLVIKIRRKGDWMEYFFITNNKKCA